jgi:hypothetical protein
VKRAALVLYAASVCADRAAVAADMVPVARGSVSITVQAPDASPPPALASPPPDASAAPAAVSRACLPALRGLLARALELHRAQCMQHCTTLKRRRLSRHVSDQSSAATAPRLWLTAAFGAVCV